MTPPAFPSPFRGFLQAGFESSTHRGKDRRQLDMVAATRHDAMAAQDYGLLADAGIATARDAARWHLIEAAPGHYDWSSFLPVLRAARRAGVQVAWDICHYGLPHDIDIFSPGFVDRFARFAGALARLVRNESDAAPIWCPVNEISFWAWSGGDMGNMHPHARGRGHALKRQLVRAYLAGLRAAREVDARARFLQAEPLINILPRPGRAEDREPAEVHRMAQFQAWDMIAGRSDADLGGSEDCLDMLGANFYFNNQWFREAETIGFGHPLFRPFPDMLAELHARYRRPIVVTETGAEGASGPGWLRYVLGEIRRALREGLPILGVCLYPAMDYPGWDDGRHCRCGLIELDADWGRRWPDPEMARQIREEAELLARAGIAHPGATRLRA